MGKGARAPHFYKLLGTGGTVSRRTRNWQNCTDHHEVAHQNDYLCFWSQKVKGHDQKNFFSGARGSVPPHFQIRSGATDTKHVDKKTKEVD